MPDNAIFFGQNHVLDGVPHRSITIDSTQAGASDSTSFPLLIAGTFSYLKSVANGGKVINPPYDIVFTSDVSGRTMLNFERVSYDAATGQVEFWVKIPTLSHTVNTVIYIRYGDATITTDQQNVTGTWDSNFKAVYHLQADGTDSTGNNTGTVVTSASQPSFIAAQIGNGASHTATNNSAYIDLGTMANLLTGATTVITFSAWIKPAAVGTTAATAIFGEVTSSNSTPLLYGYAGYGAGDNTAELTYGTTNTLANRAQSITTAFTFANSVWRHVCMVLDLTTHANTVIYVDGVLQSATFASLGSAITTFATTTAHIALFRRDSDRFQGVLDEVRFSNAIRSADWILAGYNNQKSGSTMLTISAPL